jgi:hypothetical protein
MMLIEHLIIVFCAVLVSFLVVLVFALAAQFIDVDHIFRDCGSVSDGIIKAVLCSRYKNLEEFPGECYCLKRGILHNIWVFYGFVVITLAFVGFSIGWAMHMAADGISFIP